MAENFTCSQCGDTFPKGWSDEGAAAERDELWAGVDPADCVIVCDDCFKEMLEWARSKGLVLTELAGGRPH